ncbi:Rieske (2Fe-2S) protein [Neptunicoccus cionae]|uniref:Rieske (2Fe-2S) protein n=1 Tax=Neptunicoccus cionae TaxID=2035344 RepID=UPI000C784B60|nr:Rieske (2Fe-2S) protein [Amylibacter cionae]PLS22934.1 oxidoreductase [Amylibacter cionae]
MTQTGSAPSQWVPVALSNMIEAGTSAGTVVNDAEIVVWRDTAGKAHAWEDRCPHRGMKMSFGFVRGDHIACLYHGWEYDTSGTCQYVPAHPELEVPKSICISRYGTTETGGMIWAYTPLGTLEQDSPPDLPALEGVRSVYIDAPVAQVSGALEQHGSTPAGNNETNSNFTTVKLESTVVTVGLQQISEGRCALHIAVPQDTTIATREALLDWCEDLRRSVEQLEAAA